MSKSTKLSNPVTVFIVYTLFILFFYFLIPWLKDSTVFFYRWDEAVYFFIYKSIQETGNIPTTLNYIGGIPNYIYPTLYMNLSNMLLLLDNHLNLKIASLSLQIILFLSLLISATTIYKISFLLTQKPKLSLLSGLFFLILPIISYRLFYLHATFYGNFIGISFLLLFIYYLNVFYLNIKNYRPLFLAIFFYSITLFTHHLVFMMSTIILGLDLILRIFTTKKIVFEFSTKFLFILSAVIINFGYLIKIPILQKILSVFGLAKFEQFGKEVVVKESTNNLPELFPTVILIISFISVLIIFKEKSYRNLILPALFFCFLILSMFLNKINIHLPASFRYDTFFIIPLPFLLSVFITKFKGIVLQTFFVTFLMFIFMIPNNKIANGFFLHELNSVSTGINQLNCNNTVSYFRIAPWIPTLTKSDIYYAHVDIFNAHTQRLEDTVFMFSGSSDPIKRLAMIKEKNVDCLLYEKNILAIDGVRIKGWEDWRYEELLDYSTNFYQDNNVVILKF